MTPAQIEIAKSLARINNYVNQREDLIDLVSTILATLSIERNQVEPISALQKHLPRWADRLERNK